MTSDQVEMAIKHGMDQDDPLDTWLQRRAEWLLIVTDVTNPSAVERLQDLPGGRVVLVASCHD